MGSPGPRKAPNPRFKTRSPHGLPIAPAKERAFLLCLGMRIASSAGNATPRTPPVVRRGRSWFALLLLRSGTILPDHGPHQPGRSDKSRDQPRMVITEIDHHINRGKKDHAKGFVCSPQKYPVHGGYPDPSFRSYPCHIHGLMLDRFVAPTHHSITSTLNPFGR